MTSPAFLLHLRRDPGLFGAVVRFGYSTDYPMPAGADRPRREVVHVYCGDGVREGCAECLDGTCVQRVELRANSLPLIIHGARDELN